MVDNKTVQSNLSSLEITFAEISRGDILLSGKTLLNDGGLSESDAIRLAQHGDENAFEVLYHLHCRRVYGLCLRMVRKSSEAEELTQEAFLQVFRKIRTFQGKSRFSTWLHRLTLNVVLMRLRIKSFMHYSIEEMNERNDEIGVLLPELGKPDISLSGVIHRLSLEHAVEQLPPGYKQMFILHDIEGYEHPEIAAILGCSAGNSKSQLFKARQRLRELLKQDFRNGQAQKRRKVAADSRSLVRRSTL